MKKFLAHSIILLFIFISCKKKEFPESTSNGSVFYVSAIINNQYMNISAGKSGYYMYSSFNQNQDNLYSFIAELKPSGCQSSCSNSLKFEFFDNQLSPLGGNSNINNSIRAGEVMYYDSLNSNPSPSSYVVTFKSDFNKAALGYNWTYGDGNYGTIADPTYTYTYPGIYEVCYNVTHTEGVSGICNKINVNNNSNSIRTTVHVDQIQGNTVSFSHITTGANASSFFWDFGDGNFSNLENPVHTYSNDSLYKVLLMVKSATDSSSHHYYINTGSSTQAAPNFSVSSIVPVYTATNSLSQFFGKIRISYTDMNGVIYRTDYQTQGTDKNFSIVSVEEYKLNESNNPTKKIKINFNCRLFNGSDVIEIKNGEAVIAVAYK